MRTILDQTDAPVGIEETLLAQEHEHWPEWEHGTIDPDDWAPMAEREKAEWELADTIICGSDFVKAGIEASNGPDERCQIIPYGCEASRVPARKSSAIANRPLKVLFVGTLCLRKGIQNLWQAARRLNGALFQFRAVGPTRLTKHATGQIGDAIDILDAVPRNELSNLYEWADVLVLPSISEGSAHGLPIITTANSGSIVRDGIEGNLIPPRDHEAIEQALLALRTDLDLYESMSQAALSRSQVFNRLLYGRRIIEAITQSQYATAPQL
jgi:glycosyltransferase involved in cell wall biosynthesis